MTAGRRQLALTAVVLAVVRALATGVGTAAASTPQQPAGTAAPSTGTAVPPPESTSGPPSPTPQPVSVVLSNERTVTTWAHPVEEVSIRAHPLATSRAIARIHL